MAAPSPAARRDACIPLILKEEGGFTKNPKDPGNWTGGKVGVGRLVGTKYGIAAHANPGVDIVNLTIPQAVAIYERNYWIPAGCLDLPAGVDLAVFDPAVNSGVSRARKWRERTAAITVPAARVKKISSLRRSFYQGLSTFKTFGKGWLSRVARVEAAALKMALAADGANPVAVKAQLVAEADLSTKKQGQASGAAAAAVVPATVSPAAAGFDWVGISVGVATAALCLVVAIHFIRAHAERAQALRAEAEAV